MENKTVKNQTLWLKRSKLSSLLRSLLSWQEQLSQLYVLMAHVPQVTQPFRAAFQELVGNRRHVVGLGLLLVGCLSGVLYHFFNPLSLNKEWYFINWYYFLYTIREELAIGFWAVGTFLLLPTKYKIAFIPCALILSYSIANIMHYWFFVDSLESFHNDIFLSIWVSAGALAVGLIIAVDYLCYRKYHLKDGNVARILGIAAAPGISNDAKIAIMNTLIEESQNFNARI